ncbi:MAG: DUF1566 domain-containing protein [Gammaproteobacteria bacterium]|jgi:hypothetical protein
MQTNKIRAQFTLSMTSLKRIFYNFCGLFLAYFSIGYSGFALSDSASSPTTKLPQNSPRFIKLDANGRPQNISTTNQTWFCVFDQQTGLMWEVKSRDGAIQDAQQTYSWYMPNPEVNGGFAGYKNKGKCNLPRCNTQAYIDTINRNKLCGNNRWRLPTREELRSIVDYQIKYPGPTIDKTFFPNTLNQFYWSSNPDANDKDSAWGIGFSFGYDYAYFKSDLGYVRLVNERFK